MICGSCEYTDKLCYCSMPPKVKCIFTGEYHFYNDECNCEEGDFKARKIEELGHIKKMLSEPLIISNNLAAGGGFANAIKTNDVVVHTQPCTICVKCAICEKEVAMSWYDGGVYVCDDCKKTIKFLKEKFKLELEDYAM